MTRNWILKTMGALVAASAVMTTAASAQQTRNCGPRELVVSRLAEGYGETRQSMGLGANNAVIEVLLRMNRAHGRSLSRRQTG